MINKLFTMRQNRTIGFEIKFKLYRVYTMTGSMVLLFQVCSFFSSSTIAQQIELFIHPNKSGLVTEKIQQAIDSCFAAGVALYAS